MVVNVFLYKISAGASLCPLLKEKLEKRKKIGAVKFDGSDNGRGGITGLGQSQ